jgi:DNA-binding MarR family transcriptional regulator
MADRTSTRERGAQVEQAQVEQATFGQRLRRPYVALLQRLHEEGDAKGYTDTRLAWGTNVFEHLREGGLRLTELAERSHTSKQAMRYTISRLAAAGYVEHAPDPTDGRAKIIRFTERGWQLRRGADEVLAGIEHECVRALGEGKMRQFEALLKEVSSVLEQNQA